MRTAKGLTIAILSLLSAKMHSQTLTCQYNCPLIGEVFSARSTSPVVNTSGQNQLWNFTQLIPMSNGEWNVSYLDPQSVPSSSSFPQANVVRMEWGQYTFLDAGNNGVKLVSPSTVTVNTVSMELPLPFSYGSTHTEIIITTFLLGADTIKTTTTKSLEGVGTGTLMIPIGTYTDVLRISGQMVQYSTNNSAPSGHTVTTILNYYYSEKIFHPLIYSEYKSTTGPEDYYPLTHVVHGILTGIDDPGEEKTADIRIAPNPASEKVRVTGLRNGGGQITVCNFLGQVLLSQAISLTSEQLDLSRLPEGLYTLCITQAGETQSVKLVLSW
jgi:hypothetical protein